MRFFKDLKRYFRYALYSAGCELKAQVAGSYLGWLWWILDPLLFMLVYTFVMEVVFGTTVEHFPLFVFIGLTVWNLFAVTVQSSTEIIRSYAAVTKKTYIPKFVMILMNEFVNLIKMLIGLALALLITLIIGLPITVHLLEMIPVLFVYFVLVFGVSVICANIGVFVSDFSHVMTVVIRMLFYLSGVFYTLDRLEGNTLFGKPLLSVYNMICPTGFLIKQFRDVMMYGLSADWMRLGYWFAIGILLSVIGLAVMYRNEKVYMKVS